MENVKTVSVGYSRVVNTGNYESVKLHAALEIDASDEDAKTLLGKSWNEVKTFVDAEADKILEGVR